MSTFRNNAVKYAVKWFSNERDLVRGAEDTDRSVRVAATERAGGYFKIARNLPRRYDVGRGLDEWRPSLKLSTKPRIRTSIETEPVPQSARCERDLPLRTAGVIYFCGCWRTALCSGELRGAARPRRAWPATRLAVLCRTNWPPLVTHRVLGRTKLSGRKARIFFPKSRLFRA